MNGPLPIYVINLESSADRLAFLKRQFDRLGMTFERMPAVDGRTLPKETHERYAYKWGRPISETEVACLLSHGQCWQRAADGNGAVIMEDDQVLADEIAPVLAELGPREGALIINLETRPRIRHVSREPSETIAGIRFFELQMPMPGAGAYVVTRDAAKLLLKRLERHAAIADSFIHTTPGLRRIQADPGLAIELKSMTGFYRLPLRPERQTLITRASAKKSFAKRLLWSVQHPKVRLRRVASEIQLVFKRVRAAFVSIPRMIEPSPSILANFWAMDAEDKKAGASA